MSAAVDSTVLVNSESEDEFVPRPPKRGRGRSKRNRGGGSRAARPQSSRASAARSRRQPSRSSNRNVNHTVINVGDIDTDEDDVPETPAPCSTTVSTSGSMRAVSPIGIDTLAQALGVTDFSPFKTSGTKSGLSSAQATSQDSSINLSSPANPKDTLLGSDLTSTISQFDSDYSHPQDSVPLAVPTSENIASTSTAHSENNIAPSKESDNSVAVSMAPAPKKTSRRGLAKRDAGLSTRALEGFNPELPDTAVYSHCVPSGIKTALLQGKPQKEIQEDFTTTSETQSEGENLSGAESVTKVLAVTSVSNMNSSSEIQKDNKKITEVEDEEEKDQETKTSNVLEVNDNNDDSLLLIRSPSPPPQMRGRQKVTGKRKKLNQKLSNALQTINNVKGKLDKLGKTTPKQKARGRQSDVLIVGEEEGIVKIDMIVKVRYLSTVHRISMNLDEPLHSLAGELSRLVGDVEEHELSLFHGDQLLNLSDTLRSANLSVADILDCHHIRSSAGVSGAALAGDESISLVVQCRHSRTKTTISAQKRQPLRCVIEQYAEQMGLRADSLRLTFDGDDVDPRDTPGKLDMEDLDVVDIIMTS